MSSSFYSLVKYLCRKNKIIIYIHIYYISVCVVIYKIIITLDVYIIFFLKYSVIRLNNISNAASDVGQNIFRSLQTGKSNYVTYRYHLKGQSRDSCENCIHISF